MTDIRIRVDQDGVLSDFAGAVRRRLGFDPDAPDADRRALWDMVSQDPGFWRGLDPMPGARDLWRFLAPYDPSILTGVGGDAAECERGKKEWAFAHLGCGKVTVTNSGRKPEFCRPGDILIDNSAANVAAWEAAGGIGVLHVSAAETIARLRELGVVGGARFSASLQADVEARRSERRFRREGYTGYVIAAASQRAMVAAFGVRAGIAGQPYRLVCHHVTRAFPAREDTVDEAHPQVVVVGEFLDRRTGHHVMAVTVDGEARRPDGSFFHVTYALDDSPEAEEIRKAAGGTRPTAGESNRLLRAAVDAAGGNQSALFNLPPERRVRLDVDFALLDQQKLAALPRARAPRPDETVEVEPFEFGQGVRLADGSVFRTGQRTVRRKGDQETVSYDLVLADGSVRKHAEDGVPAIERRDVRTGQVLFRAWARDGLLFKEPWADEADARPAPG